MVIPSIHPSIQAIMVILVLLKALLKMFKPAPAVKMWMMWYNGER